jgi:apolipoprotein N-acyltransferase
VHRRVGLPLFIAVPVIWVAVELARGLVLTGFPWFLLGHSQPTVMIQVADFAGAYGVSFVVALTAGLVVDLLTMPLIRAGRGVNPAIAAGLATWLVVTLGALGYGGWRMGQAVESSRSLNIAVVQTDVPQSNKLAPTNEQDLEHFNTMLQLSRRAMASDPDLIVWPETAVPRPINAESYRVFDNVAQGEIWRSYRDQLLQFAQTHDVQMIVGGHRITGWSVRREPSRGGEYYRPGRRYNVAYLLGPRRGLADRYAKVHRVPFGEYVLFEQTLPWLADWLRVLAPVPGYSLSPGQAFNLLHVYPDPARKTEPWRIGAPICFEDAFSYACREMVYDGGAKRADLLVNLTNDGWYPGTGQPLQHEQLARFRCVENRVPMARAVNRGVSAVLDSSGRVIDTVTVNGKRRLVAGVVTAEVHADARSTLFGRIGDLLAEVCAVVTMGLLLLGLLRGRRVVQDR